MIAHVPSPDDPIYGKCIACGAVRVADFELRKIVCPDCHFKPHTEEVTLQLAERLCATQQKLDELRDEIQRWWSIGDNQRLFTVMRRICYGGGEPKVTFDELELRVAAVLVVLRDIARSKGEWTPRTPSDEGALQTLRQLGYVHPDGTDVTMAGAFALRPFLENNGG